ncbi:MAG TPA: hypothetical protein VF085_05125 [Solirubrobacterales bacterium]
MATAVMSGVRLFVAMARSLEVSHRIAEMREAVIVEEHRDHDPEEAAYRRRELIMALAAASFSLDFSSGFVP